MKRLITAILLLLSVFALCAFTQIQLTHLTDSMSAQIDHFSLCARLNDPTGARTAIAAAQSDWVESRTLLGAILPHSELDEIDRLFAVSRQAIENGDLPECRLRAAELSARLRHLPERERPTLANVL